MGLLNITDDPQTLGLLSLGLRLMSTPGKFGTAFGQAGLGAMGDLQAAQQAAELKKQRELQQQMQQMQLDEAKRQAEMDRISESAAKAAFVPGMPGMVDTAAGSDGINMPAQDPRFDMTRYMTALAQGGNAKGAMQAYMATQKDRTPLKVGANETVLDPVTFKPLFTNKPPEELPKELKVLEQIYGKDTPEYFAAAKMLGTKMTTHAPGTSVSINTEKPLMNELASGLGKQIDASLANARSATSAINTAQRLKGAIDSGKVIAGPGASFRVLGLQVGQMLGVGGKDGAEVLSNTRTAIQSMAQAELDAAQQMKGQGQITEAERDIIRRAASGNIDSMTAPEIRLLADAMEKTARWKIAAHRKNVSALERMPNAAALLPFYQIDEPPAYQAPGMSADDLVKKYGKP